MGQRLRSKVSCEELSIVASTLELTAFPFTFPMAIIVHDNQKRDLVSSKTIFDYADDLKVQVPTSCGRAGICHECVVEIKQGMEALSPRGEAESFLRDHQTNRIREERMRIFCDGMPLRRGRGILEQCQIIEPQLRQTVMRHLAERVNLENRGVLNIAV